jgi:RimJ/RimL family protein N-acetyltransferase
MPMRIVSRKDHNASIASPTPNTEVGWMVVPEFQGRGIAVAATSQAVELAKRDDQHRFMHAFPTRS